MKVFINICVAFSFYVQIFGCVQGTETCREPENAELQIASALYELYMDPGYSNFTLNVVPCFHERFPATAIIYENQTIPNVCDNHQRNANCIDGDISPNVLNNDVTRVPKSCSWEYMLDIEENRIPRVIAKAKCTCLHCHRGTCGHIYSFIPVLHKQCNRITDVYTYRKSIMRVPVGCSCFLSGHAGEPGNYNRRLVMTT